MDPTTARPGDRIIVETNTIGAEPRRGSVLAVAGTNALRVRWDDGHESTFVPGSDCRTISDDERTSLTLGSHIDLRVMEDDDHCEAVARLTTSRGTFEARGQARRHPDDPSVPMIGEELAIGRALDALSRQLMGEASAAIARHEQEPVHLLT